MTDIVGKDIKFIRLNDKDLIGRCMEVGFFEGNNVATAAQLLAGHENGVVLDIGANMGSFTVPLAFYNKQFNFVCFEPQRMVYYQLCGNLALNGLTNVHAINKAVGEKEDMIYINVPDYSEEENIGAFSLDYDVRQHEDYLCKTRGLKQRIDIDTLDSFQIGGVVLIKIDVEGMELSVLKGAIETIKHNNYPPIMFEAWTHKEWFEPRRAELIKFLENLGYEIDNYGEDNVAIYKGEVK